MNLQTPGLIAEAGFMALPGGGPAIYRQIARRRMEYPDANSALYQILTPVAGITHTYDQFTTQIRLDTVGLLNDAGAAAKFARLYALMLAVSPYRPDLAASGSIAASFTACFAPGTVVHTLTSGDICLFACSGSGTPISGSSSLALAVTSPVNLAIELLLIGKET